MQFVSANDVREGMCVAEHIYDPQGRILIARGQKIGGHHIVRLRKFHIQSIFIDPTHGENVEKPTKSELRDQCVKVLSDSCGRLTKEFAAKRINLDANAIRETIDHLLEALLKSKNPLVTLLDISTSSDRLLQHSVNVTVLATVLAADLRVPEAMIRDLATGMLFHDIGLIFLPENVAYKCEPLTQQDVNALCRHAELGFEHLVRSDAVSPTAANIALRHHETLDGSGYPHKVGADKLTTLMKIAAVAEVYDSLTTPRFGLPPVMPDAALTYILSHAGTLFAREVVVALSRHITLYPVNSAVQLNTGEKGIVAGVLPTAPMRPVVLAHFDHRGKQLKEPIIVDLTADSARSVTRSAPTLQGLLQSPEPAAAPMPVHPVYARLG